MFSSRPSLRVTAAGLLGSALLVACSSDPPAPEGAARSLANGLAALDLAAVPLADGVMAQNVTAELSAITAGLGGVLPTAQVEGTDVADDGRTAQAVLSLGWDLDGDQDWSYRSTAQLVLRDDAWLVAWAPSALEPSLEPGERLVASRAPAERGEVLGAGGAVLVTDRPVLRVGLDKTRADAAALSGSSERLAALIGIDGQAYAARVQAAGPRGFVEAIVLRADDPALPSEQEVASIPGAVLLPDELALAPTRDFARPLLGTVGEVTAEVVEASNGRLRAGDVAGLSGLQAGFEQQLGGRPGVVVRAESDNGPGRELFSREPVGGRPLQTTLDPDLQSLAENILAPVEPASAIVAVRPSTGDVLVAASGPGSEGHSTATLGQYAPGSTFKVVTALGLLRTGLTADSPLDCPISATVDGRAFSNYSDYPAGASGPIPLRSVIANSCNTALIGQTDRLSQADLASAALSLGLGQDLQLGAAAFGGDVPVEAGLTESAASMIGQGRVSASPLAMATVAASVSAGQTVRPRLVTESAAPQQEAAGPPLDAQEAAMLRELMRGVVTEGSASFLLDVPGEPVGAKTGTAEYGSDQPPRTHAWMIAVQGDLAVAVFVEDGASGSATAGPALETFLRGSA